jgi:hypothetical protein
MRNPNIMLLIVACAIFILVVPLKAQDERVNWFAFTGGAGVLNSSEHSVVSSVAQTFTGISALDNNRISSGFWYDQVTMPTDVKEPASHPGFILNQNYPNPFSSITTIGWQIPVASQVTLEIYDILGNKVRNLVNEYLSPGEYQVDFASETLTNGIYVIRLRAGGFMDSKIMNLVR